MHSLPGMILLYMAILFYTKGIFALDIKRYKHENELATTTSQTITKRNVETARTLLHVPTNACINVLTSLPINVVTLLLINVLTSLPGTC